MKPSHEVCSHLGALAGIVFEAQLQCARGDYENADDLVFAAQEKLNDIKGELRVLYRTSGVAT